MEIVTVRYILAAVKLRLFTGYINTMHYERAAAYALHKLENELPNKLCYHGVHHTRDDVVPAVKRIAANYPLSEEDRTLLLTAAWFHDLGFTERYNDNEVVAVDIVYEVLPTFGYSPAQAEVVVGIIIATRPPQNATNLLEKIMVDADLDSLGRADFFKVAGSLRHEQEIFLGEKMSDVEWYRMEMRFFSAHKYFTNVQRYRRTSGKLQNFMKLYRCMVDAQEEGNR